MFRTSFVFAALAAATAIAAPGHADSLDAFAAKHFNASVSAADRQSAIPGSVDPSLDAAALARFNTSASSDEVQPATVSGRNVASTGNYGQLTASAGASAGASLDEIAAAKFRHDQTQTER
jgi:hypothetical protein